MAPPSAGVAGARPRLALTLSMVSRMRGTPRWTRLSDLGSKLFESLGAERAGSPPARPLALAGSQRDGTGREAQPSHFAISEIAIELLELTAQSSKVTRHCSGYR